MRPIQIDVVIPTLTSLELGCTGCAVMMDQTGLSGQHRESCSDEFPEEWKQDRAKLGELVENLRKLYKHRIHIRIIDAQSPMGLWKKIRHRFRSMPAFIVDRSYVCTGWDCEQLETIIDSRIQEECLRMDERTRASFPECG